jgi:hypothetical protein
MVKYVIPPGVDAATELWLCHERNKRSIKSIRVRDAVDKTSGTAILRTSLYPPGTRESEEPFKILFRDTGETAGFRVS